jgi:hypothetical protein
MDYWKLLAIPSAIWGSLQISERVRGTRAKHPKLYKWSLFLAALVIAFWLGALITARRNAGPTATKPDENAPAAKRPPISQKAQDSDCSNIVAGRDANVNCSAPEKDDGKNKTLPNH